MGLFDKIRFPGATKNDVKVAKLELKKAKEENKKIEKERKLQKEAEKKQKALGVNRNELPNYLEYAKNNFYSIKNKILKLKIDAEKFTSGTDPNEWNDTFFKENAKLLKRNKSDINNLGYLYLSKDFLSTLIQLDSGITLSDEKAYLIIKFAPFFDDVDVLGKEAQEIKEAEDDDVSLFGMLKETAKDFGSIFYQPKNSESKQGRKFSLQSYLAHYYSDKIKKFIVPEVNDTLESFEKLLPGSSRPRTQTEFKANLFECSNCHASLDEGAKFCQKCGTRVEVDKPAFCSECGTQLKSGTKFCPNCGQKT